jgi:hypothetical protein
MTIIAVLLVEPIEAKLEAVREAINDPLFLADLQEVAEDFKYVDAEGEAQRHFAGGQRSSAHFA